MSKNPSESVVRQIGTLFRLGMLADVTDGQLLDRFVRGSKDEAEAAFAVLMERHGPMVLRVCQQQIGDPHEAQDAYQAVFLVLARSHRLIRNRNSLGSWLHGVALRTSSKFLASAHRRRTVERQGALTAAERKGDVVNAAEASWSDLHEELSRLPERYRAPLVLCYLEGRTHEEAAAQLGWPLGTLKTRLNRGRERLKNRLIRKGLAPTADILVPAGMTWFPATEDLVRTTMTALSITISGESAGAGTVPAYLISRAEEVIWAMFLSKLKPICLMLIFSGVVVAGVGSVLGQAARERQSQGIPAFDERAFDDLKKARVEAAKKRLDAQKAFLDAGRITLDRYISASAALMLAEADASETAAEEVDAARRHLERVKQVEASETVEFNQGRSSIADLEEARSNRLDAEYHFMKTLMEARLPARPSTSIKPAERDSRRETPGVQHALKIRPRFECVVEKIMVQNGQHVTKGEPLLELFSTALAQAKNEYVIRKLEALYDTQKIPRFPKGREVPENHELQSIEANANRAKSRLQEALAHENLLILGLTPEEVQAIGQEKGDQKARLTIKAPFDGKVTEIGVQEGDFADVKSLLLRLEPISAASPNPTPTPQ